MLKTGYYKNKHFRDVFVQILSSYEKDNKTYLLVNYWNFGFTGNPWVVLEEQNLVIPEDKYSDWEPLDNTQILEISNKKDR